MATEVSVHGVTKTNNIADFDASKQTTPDEQLHLYQQNTADEQIQLSQEGLQAAEVSDKDGRYNSQQPSREHSVASDTMDNTKLMELLSGMKTSIDKVMTDVNTVLNPFDTIGVSATPLPPAHIWAQGTPKNHIKPRNEVSEW